MTTTPEETGTETQEATVVTPATAETYIASTETDGGELLAGKFKSTEDLEKAYKELETKLGQTKTQPDPADTTAEEQPETDTDAADPAEEKPDAEDDGGDDPYAAYGEAVGNALKEAEVDPAAAAAEFEKDGTLSEETFEKFNKAGFPKEVVEAYLRGVAQHTETVTQITDAQIAEIKSLAGGDDGYKELSKWMAANATPEQLTAYNDTLSTGNTADITAAVRGMVDRYNADIGREGTLLGGRPPAPNAGYASEAEYLADVANPEYKKSQAFRDTVAKKLMASPNVLTVR